MEKQKSTTENIAVAGGGNVGSAASMILAQN